ncbi:hypothetical protein BTN98_08675 [Photobacterium aquimaris]|uniref:glycosyltransferase family 2 protein n=1 Tax=Photobacterium aquimaris TaxID=512643 RepID=UPI00076A50D7|nr:glycosyltransferase family 2 protein [Photobacterium aquimaris]PQJ41675.1 hypothetical protein BTN98_08675 [Photobacterium aquimaris]
MIDISIIIPTCNRLDLLRRVLTSLLSQNLDENTFEVLVVDDSPVDMTGNIIHLLNSYSFKYKKVIRNNGEHSAARARNLGASKALGYYITFVDDDDLLLPDRLSNLLKVAKSNPQYSLISSGRLYELNDFESYFQGANQRFGKINVDDIAIKNDIDIGFLIEKSMFQKLNGFDPSFYAFEDWDFIIRALKIKPAFKITRFDYAVNSNLARPRVSNGETLAYAQLINKHKLFFGTRWLYIMKSIDLANRRELGFCLCVSFAFKSQSLKPIRSYISSKLK